MKRYYAAVLMSLTLAACEKKEVADGTISARPSAAVEATAAASAVATAAPVIDLDTLPVEEDFEADAEKELTVSNLNAKLDELDKEISAP